MKLVTKLPLALALIVSSVTSPVFADDGYYGVKEEGHYDGHQKGKLEKKLRAEATIAGPGITGEAHLYEENDGLVLLQD
ncbi:MAG: hypothetical protein NTV37_04565 [Proteobacteria bacterium]|nr:hypothetical protein [Pseudomonadota bacterium]